MKIIPFSLWLALAGMFSLSCVTGAKADDGTLPFALDLKPFYNYPFVTASGTNRPYHEMFGRQVIDGLPFELDGKLLMDGRNDNGKPVVSGIKIGREFAELHLVHTAQWHEYHGCPIATIRLHYADGASHDFALRYDDQVMANRLLTEEKEILTDPDSKLVWRGPGPNKGESRLVKTILQNPFPNKRVDTMEVVSTHSRASYVLVAATVAARDSGRPVTSPVPLNQPEWSFDGVLTVHVVNDATGTPLAGADVYPHMDVDDFGVVADPILTASNGVALVKYPVSRTSYVGVTVTVKGLQQHSETWQRGNIPEEMTCRLGVAPTISGVVRGPDGKPAAGVTVQFVGRFGSREEAIQTDPAGKFELEWNRNQFPGQNDSTACVLVRDAEHNLAAAQDMDEDTTNVQLTLAPGLILTGRVEADGKPLASVGAQLVFWSGRSGMWLQGLARTNTPGRYEIPALPPGRKYGVIVSAPGYGQKQLFNLDISADPGRQELDPVELMPANLKIAGQVLDADDKPVASCSVQLNGDGQPSAQAHTDHDGRFTFAHVCEGSAQLFANGQGTFGNVSAEGGDTNVVLHLGQNYGSSPSAQSHKLKGLVTDPDGKPMPGVELAVFPNFNGGTHWIKSGPVGEYNLTWSLQPWQLQNGGGARLVARDDARSLATIEELSEDATNLDLKLKPALTLAGLVKNEADAPMPGAQIGFWIKAGNSYGQMDEQVKPADAQGRYEIKCLPADGQYMVYATAKGYGKSTQQVESDSETNRQELSPLVLKLADQIIAGQVLKDEDKPASGVNVNLSGEGQPDGQMTTDSKGRFHFQVCAGQIRLFAFLQSGGGFAQTTAEAGDTNIVITLTSQPGMARQAPSRHSLKGTPLPDLTAVNLAVGAAPAGKPVLVCLFDASQRPSRHVLHLLDQQAAALVQKNVAVLGVQAAIIADDVFNEWKTGNPVSFPVGRVTEKSDKAKWASSVTALPWLVLTDASHRVMAEGFSLDELDVQIQKLAN